MKTIRYIVAMLVLLSVFGCNGVYNKSVKLSEREAYRYDKALQEVEEVEKLCEQTAAQPSRDAIMSMLSRARSLKYNYDDEAMNEATISHCDSLKQRIDKCQYRALEVAQQMVKYMGKIHAVDVHRQLFTEQTYYPLYLKEGEKLFCEIESSAVLTAKLYNADTERLIKSYKSSKFSDSLTISHSGIYLMEITPQTKQYVSLVLGYRLADETNDYHRPGIYTEQVECKKGDFGAKGVSGITMRACFDEPRKLTLRGQIKAAFSGHAKSLVAVQIPAGATDILYSVRIDTSESDCSSDGKFHDNLAHSYRRIKFLGLPLYESTKNSGLLATLLDDNHPISDRDAYCNMYVFRSQSQAKQFQDGTKASSSLNYDVDYSAIGTQSCNGRIPTKGAKVIYLGFENERMRYANYLWVEVEAVVPTTVYYRTKYRVN